MCPAPQLERAQAIAILKTSSLVRIYLLVVLPIISRAFLNTNTSAKIRNPFRRDFKTSYKRKSCSHVITISGIRTPTKAVIAVRMGEPALFLNGIFMALNSNMDTAVIYIWTVAPEVSIPAIIARAIKTLLKLNPRVAAYKAMPNGIKPPIRDILPSRNAAGITIRFNLLALVK